MANLKLTVAYDGTRFSGFQRQPGRQTVQGVLEEVLGELAGREVQVFGAGRTDAGVHARAQVVHLDWPGPVPWQRLPQVLLRRLPDDVAVLDAAPAAEDFHARYSAVGKCYRYTVDRSPVPDVFRRRYAYHEPRPLAVDAMRAAAEQLEGTHDFTSFCAAATPVSNKVRTVYAVRLAEEGSLLHVYVIGDGFLYQMVRIMVGTLVEVGLGRRSPSAVGEILAARDRRRAGVTAPAKGLTLWEVYYSRDELEDALRRLS